MPAGNIYCIEDTKARISLNFWLAENDDVALRLLHDPLTDTDHAFHKHPRDYELVFLGTWDPDTQNLVAADRPRYVCNLSEILAVPSDTFYETPAVPETVETTNGASK